MLADINSLRSTMLDGLQNGGPAGLVYGFLFVWCGASFQTLVMAEMASMYVEPSPDTLGLYLHFVELQVLTLKKLNTIAVYSLNSGTCDLPTVYLSSTNFSTGFR